jgi:hypothetical protein
MHVIDKKKSKIFVVIKSESKGKGNKFIKSPNNKKLITSIKSASMLFYRIEYF